MRDIDEVLARITRDPGFADQLGRDPRSALAPYELTTAELRCLADRLGAGEGRERRGGHSALRALLTGDE